jgi:NAD(P)H-dependent flavin oxidoreductase YrpB (nitropropane dioxygenase family)
MTALANRLTDTLGIRHPIISAPMAFVGGGELAAAVTRAGGLGPRYRQALADGDPDNAAVWFGEAAGLIDTIEPVATIIERMVNDAAKARLAPT